MDVVSQIVGVIDLMIALPGGEEEVVVEDHKGMPPVWRERCAENAAAYAGQLQSYREALDAQGIEVREAGSISPWRAPYVGLELGRLTPFLQCRRRQCCMERLRVNRSCYCVDIKVCRYIHVW